MCGITGWINFNENISEQRKAIERMTDTLAARGPDASGIWSSTNALLGHRRLTVIDPEGGGQPMTAHQGDNTYVIVYNGELYNTEDLRKELKSYGYEFSSSSDTEVLLKSYIKWGAGCAERINGIYAFGIWNQRDKSLFLCRDRFGVKPLFYTVKGESFIFASEIKALLVHPFVNAEIDKQGISEIIGLGPARTPGKGVFKGIYELEPAQYFHINKNGIYKRYYWSLESKPHEDNLEKTTQTVRDLVVDAIKRQLVSDVPICTFLSGGLDSSAITAVSSNMLKKKGAVLNTYSIDYINNDLYFKSGVFQPDADEPWVKRMSEEFGTFHKTVKTDTGQLIANLEAAVKARDLPGMADVDSSLLIFCREVKKDATVALSGECADEIFGGYPWFYRQEMLSSDYFPWSPSTLERAGLLSGEIASEKDITNYVAAAYEQTVSNIPLSGKENCDELLMRKMMYLNLTWFMSVLLDRKDRMSMSTGLEVRVPFCDHRIVEYLWNVPWEMKYLQNREKGLLRYALKGILPEDVLWRKKSPYPKTHNPAYAQAVKALLQDILNDPCSPILTIINKKIVQLMLDTDGKSFGKQWFGQLMSTPQIFAYLIQLDIWLREYKIHIV